MMAWCSSSDATEDDHTYIGVLGFESQLQFLSQFQTPAEVYPGSQQRLFSCVPATHMGDSDPVSGSWPWPSIHPTDAGV